MPTRATEIFTPNDFPTHTYVERQGEDLEKRLRESLETPRQIASISGPSKSGKSVLVAKVVSPSRILLVSGAEIRSVDDLWTKVLDSLDLPQTTTDASTTTSTSQTGNQASLNLGVPGLSADFGQSDQLADTVSTGRTTTRGRGGLQEVADLISDGSNIVFIDDFHYIDPELQSAIARQIKTASERGVRMVVALVPHRSDDVVRTNPELRGRVRHIDMGFWSTTELERIAVKGFDAMNLNVAPKMITDFAREACGSPQLMQTICLQACFISGYAERPDSRGEVSYGEGLLTTVLEASSSTVDYSSLVAAFHSGPRIRGTERNTYAFKDETTGDVYRAVLLAIQKSPPLLTLSYQELLSRVEAACQGTAPTGSSITQACEQLHRIAMDRHSDQRIIEWDNDTLNIVDPYLLFYLRSSRKLMMLGEKSASRPSS